MTDDLVFTTRSYLHLSRITLAVAVAISRRKLADIIQTAVASLALLLALALFIIWKLADRIAG